MQIRKRTFRLQLIPQTLLLTNLQQILLPPINNPHNETPNDKIAAVIYVFSLRLHLRIVHVQIRNLVIWGYIEIIDEKVVKVGGKVGQQGGLVGYYRETGQDTTLLQWQGVEEEYSLAGGEVCWGVDEGWEYWSQVAGG